MSDCALSGLFSLLVITSGQNYFLSQEGCITKSRTANPSSLDIDFGDVSHQGSSRFIGKREGSSKFRIQFLRKKKNDGIAAPSTITIVKDTIDLLLKISFAVFLYKTKHYWPSFRDILCSFIMMAVK